MERSISEWVQGTIWLLSLASIPLYFMEEISTVNNSSMRSAAFFFGIITFFQQLIIYVDVNKFERKFEEAKKVYGEWLESKWESFFRYLIFLALLFGAGKITDAIYPWTQCQQPSPENFGEQSYLCELILPFASRQNDLFIIGAITVFSCVLIWNVFAIKSQRKTIYSNKSKKCWITIRIVMFAISAVFALAYWLLILLGYSLVGEYSIALVVMYCATAIFVILFRSEKVLQFMSSKVKLDF